MNPLKQPIVLILFSVLLLFLLQHDKNVVTATSWEDAALFNGDNETFVPLSETGFTLTFLGSSAEEDPSLGVLTTFTYHLQINETEKSISGNLSLFALSLCSSDRDLIVDHTPEDTTLEIVDWNSSHILLILKFDDSGSLNGTNGTISFREFNFTVTLTGNLTTEEGEFLVTNGSVIANGTTLVPECVVAPPPASNTSVLCAEGLQVCGQACYSTDVYVCFDGNFLCPVNHLKCNFDCYRPTVHVCINNTVLCPVTAPLRCGAACYSSDLYGCDENNNLFPVVVGKPSPTPSPIASPSVVPVPSPTGSGVAPSQTVNTPSTQANRRFLDDIRLFN